MGWLLPRLAVLIYYLQYININSNFTSCYRKPNLDRTNPAPDYTLSPRQVPRLVLASVSL